MKSLVRVTAFVILLLPAIVAAQAPQQHPLAGFWAGPMVEGDQNEVIVELRIQGEVVTGPIETSQIGDLYIRDGSVSANSVHFTSPSLDPNGQGGALVWTGQLTGNNALAFSVVPASGDGAAREFVLKKRDTTGSR